MRATSIVALLIRAQRAARMLVRVLGPANTRQDGRGDCAIGDRDEEACSIGYFSSYLKQVVCACPELTRSFEPCE